MIYLNHPLNNDTPLYGGVKEIKIIKSTSISEGDTANSIHFSMPNHVGTHIDVPKHFFDNGKTLSDYPASFWFFQKPQLIDVSCDDGQLIIPLEIVPNLNNDTDILLIRTRYEKYRQKTRYWSKNPGISVELAMALRSNFPSLRAVGMDFISVTSRLHREEGKKTHREFLGNNYQSEPIVLIEDMSLIDYTDDINKIIVSPLMIQDADGAPCTIIAM